MLESTDEWSPGNGVARWMCDACRWEHSRDIEKVCRGTKQFELIGLFLGFTHVPIGQQSLLTHDRLVTWKTESLSYEL